MRDGKGHRGEWSAYQKGPLVWENISSHQLNKVEADHLRQKG
jgi:hypothetical protein